MRETLGLPICTKTALTNAGALSTFHRLTSGSCDDHVDVNDVEIVEGCEVLMFHYKLDTS